MNNVISTKVSFVRNLKDYKFVPKLEDKKRQEIIDKLTVALKGKLNYVELSSIDSNVADYLLSNDMIEQSNLIDGNCSFISQKENLIITTFEGEHINIKATEIGYSLKDCFKKASDIVKLLKDKINLSYNDDYGYLTSDLSRIGTGLKLECVLNLPSIYEIDKIDQVKQNVRKLGYELLETETSGNYTLSTLTNLGMTESNICSDFDKMVQKLQDLEVESAKMLDMNNHDELFDKFQRASAIMSSAYLMSVEELSRLLSSIRTGINLGFNSMFDINKLNSLQKLIINKNQNFASKSSLISLAEQMKKIIKGE